MMEFRKIQNAIRRLLAQNADGEFNVIGAQKRGKSADEVSDKGRLVEVYYSRGEFPKSGASTTGPTNHNMTFRIDLTVAKATEVDTETILDPNKSAGEVARAMAAARESDLLADESLDDLFDHVYQIIMDARNIDLGLDKGSVGSRWLQSLTKDEPLEKGNFTVITGSMVLSCSAKEPVDGYSGVAGEVIDIGVDIETDATGKAGVQTGA